MAAQSTLRLAVLQHCHKTVHPCTRSCLFFFFSSIRRAVLASFIQFGSAYGVSALIKLLTNGYRSDIVLEALRDAVRSSLSIGVGIGATFGFTCVFRHVVGSYTQWTTAFAPTFVGSSFFLLEHTERWNMLAFLLGNSHLERLLLLRSRATGLRLEPTVLSLIFMGSSGVLLYLLRRPDFRCMMKRTDNPWFFYPSTFKESQIKDDVSQTSWRYVKVAVQLWGIGLALQMVRRPANVMQRLGQFNTHRLGLFFAGYVAIYAVCSWALLRVRGRDDAWHAAPAGMLAGATLRLFPDANIAVMPIAVLLQILAKWYCKKKSVNNVFIWKFLFVSLSIAYLAHLYYVDPDFCPKWLVANLGTFSGGVATETRFRVLKLWATHRFTILQGGL